MEDRVESCTSSSQLSSKDSWSSLAGNILQFGHWPKRLHNSGRILTCTQKSLTASDSEHLSDMGWEELAGGLAGWIKKTNLEGKHIASSKIGPTLFSFAFPPGSRLQRTAAI